MNKFIYISFENVYLEISLSSEFKQRNIPVKAITPNSTNLIIFL